jgi:hypothetical protein
MKYILKPFDELKQNNTERRGGEDESFLLTDVIKKFIQRTENERKAEKARWLPLYEIIYDELGDEYYQEQGQTRTRKAFTVAELQEALEFMMIGNKVIIRCLNSVIRFELYCLRNYILDRLNAETKTFITKLIFC